MFFLTVMKFVECSKYSASMGFRMLSYYPVQHKQNNNNKKKLLSVP